MSLKNMCACKENQLVENVREQEGVTNPSEHSAASYFKDTQVMPITNILHFLYPITIAMDSISGVINPMQGE